MAIQNRRGAYVDLNPAKAVPGELLVVQSGDPNTTDGKAVYMTFASGDIKLLAMRSDVETAVADVAEDLLVELDNTISTFTETTAPGAVADVADEGAAQITAIGNKGDEVLGSIPSDYSTLSGDVSDLKSAFNDLYIPYEWQDGYYALGTGAFTSQTGNVTYHSTEKIDGSSIPADTEFINSEYLYLSDSFFAVWDGTTYKGYLMNNVWHNPNGSVPSKPPAFTKYAIVLHNVSDYQGLGRRKYANIPEVLPGVNGNDKASLLVDAVSYANVANIVTVSTSNGYGYKATKRVFLKSITPFIEDGASVTVYMYLLRLQNDNTYNTEKSTTVKVSTPWVLDTVLNVNDAILFIYSGGTQRFSPVNNKDYFSKCYGWNNNTKILVDSTNEYYVPATITLYDPITNYLLNYTDNGNPCNWKGSECSLFDNILCIGDSITQGAPTPPDITPDQSKATRTVNNQIMYSYPASMKKQWGVECTNWGRSGIDTPDWYEYYSTNEPSWSGHDAAIMLIGNNDYHIADDMGGLTPENLSTVSALSKSAMMDIITKLKADNADIKIFICTLLPGWDIGNSLSPYVVQNIRDIAEDEDNVYLIDLSKYSIIKNSSPYMYGHPTALGYNQLAREIGGAIGYTIVNNPNDFRWIQFIGTEYAMDGQ